MKSTVITCLVAITILVGCSTPTQQAANQMVFPRSQGMSYLDASREVIEGQGWALLSERGSTRTGTESASEQVTITGQTPEGKKVFFTLSGSSAEQSASLEVTTDTGFPVSSERLLELVRAKRKG